MSSTNDCHCFKWGGGQGTGARENRGRERNARRERKGREAGVQRWRDAGMKFKTLLVDISYALKYLKNKNARCYLLQ